MDEVTDATFADEVLASTVPVIVDFWAPWCKPCEAIEPHLRGIAGDEPNRVRLDRAAPRARRGPFCGRSAKVHRRRRARRSPVARRGCRRPAAPRSLARPR